MSDIAQEFKVFDLDRQVSLRILEPPLVVAVSDDLGEKIASFARCANSTDSTPTQSNWVASTSLFVRLLVWILGRKVGFEQGVLVREPRIGKSFSNVSNADICDMREAHNMHVLGIKLDLSFL